MKVIHIESGLGNQMLSYCEYLAIKKVNPDDDCYIETTIYDISEAESAICQWNGYELERIFGIHAPNVKELFDGKEWENIIDYLKRSRFWEKNWNYPVYITDAFRQSGLNLLNMRGDFEKNEEKDPFIKRKLRKTFLFYKLKCMYYALKREKLLKEAVHTDELFMKTDENVFTGQKLHFILKGNNIEKIDKEIRETFVFPRIDDEKNLGMMKIIQSSNSIAIHARRGDMLGVNYPLYKYGYFRRAVRFIKKRADNPVFVFFCDPGSIRFCKENAKVFGLDFKKDKVYFTDWNKGDNSFRDMQLMAECKHQIITNSSFGFWGAYLNKNPDKITISPGYTINTTHHFN